MALNTVCLSCLSLKPVVTVYECAYCSIASVIVYLTSLAVWIWSEFLSKSGTYICRGEFTATFAWWHLNVHLSIRLYTPTGPALTVQPRHWWQLSADVARCAATCDVDKLAQHRWHVAVERKGKEFYQLQLTTNWQHNRHGPLMVLDMH